MTQPLQDRSLPPRFPMEITGSRDQDGAGMVYVRCNDGTIWLDINAASMPWRKLPAIPEPTAEELEEAEKRQQAAFEAAMGEGKRMDEALQANRERLAEERLGIAQAEALLREEREATQKALARHSRPWWRQ